MDDIDPLNTAAIVAAATATMLTAGYQRVPEASISAVRSADFRVFEDPYGVVAIVVYDSWVDLKSNWPDAQGSLVDLISKFMHRSEAKAWEGYVVLLTPGVVPSSERLEVSLIARNTSRVRKLIATGEELLTINDVETVLLPVLPVNGAVATTTVSASVLEALPHMLETEGIPAEAVRTLISAFAKQESLLEALHRSRDSCD